jgi:hypothetical protein
MHSKISTITSALTLCAIGSVACSGSSSPQVSTTGGTGNSGGTSNGGDNATGGLNGDGGSNPTGGAANTAGRGPTGGAATGGAGNSNPDTFTFSIDMSKGPASQFAPPATPVAVSPYIYGINGFGKFVAQKTKWGLVRQGGDANSAYNWTIDYTNMGADYCYQQQQIGNGNLAGEYTATTGDTIATALAKGEAFLATIPILDYVAAKWIRNVGWSDSGVAPCGNGGSAGTDSACPANNGTYRANVVDTLTGDPGKGQPLSFVSSNPNSPAFVKNSMAKGSAFCSCAPGTPTCTGCTTALNPVAQDEFVNFLKVNYSSGSAPVFFDLDNEPNYWPSTHPELYASNCNSGTVSWDDVITRDVNAAKAAKSAWSNAKVFAPVVAQDGVIYGGDYSSPHFVAGKTEFADYYLQQVAAQSVAAGETLIDVFDTHYYTPGSTDALCLEAPRLFWDPNATDISAAITNSIDFNFGDHSYFDQNWYPRQMIPRVQRKIATAFSGKSVTAPNLSFSEYNAGCEMAISGGVAEADLLGIFGREGVFAATAWPLKCPSGGSCGSNFLVAAFDLYRNYDGNGSVVGDTAVLASTSDDKNSSVYAFAHADNTAALDIVAINKETRSGTVTITIAQSPLLQSAKLYNLVAGSAAVVAVSGTPSTVSCSGGNCSLSFTMPAMSATTINLR